MVYDIKFWYTQKYLPTKRHRKERTRIVEDVCTVEVKEVLEKDFPIAFIVHEYQSVYEDAKTYCDFKGQGTYKIFAEEIRTYNGKLYTPVRVSHGSAISLHFEPLDYIKWKLQPTAPYRTEEEKFTKESIVRSDTRGTAVKDIEKHAANYLIYQGKLWSECGEPMYYVITFGLGHNHGGTGFGISYHYNPNIPSKNYFNALQRKEAIAFGHKTALNRGDTKSVESMGKNSNIEVVLPELVHRNPQKDHGNGNPFLNSLESVITGSSSVTEAGLLAMALNGVSRKTSQNSNLMNQKR